MQIFKHSTCITPRNTCLATRYETPFMILQDWSYSRNSQIGLNVAPTLSHDCIRRGQPWGSTVGVESLKLEGVKSL